jgi:hypothetical protein
MPQGSLKKIEIQLLLADLALQFGNAFARRLKLRGWCLRRRQRTCATRSQTGSCGLARPTTAAQRLRTPCLETIRQTYRSLRVILSSRARALTFSPASIRQTIPTLNSRLKTR